MICPYRKKLEINEHCGGKTIEETYMECYKCHCPYYEPLELRKADNEHWNAIGYCQKASKEIYG